MDGYQSQIYKVEIPNWTQHPQHVTYEIHINTFDNQGSWLVSKRFSEIFLLNSSLEQIYSDMPLLPNRTLIKISNPQDLDQRRLQLDRYFRELIKRIDIISSAYFQEFFDVLLHSPNLQVQQPQLLTTLNSFNQTVRDFFLSETENLIFIVSAEQNPLQRFDCYISHFRMPWEQGETSVNAAQTNPIGKLEHWKFGEDALPVRLWSKNYISMAICLHWESITCMMTVGLDNGVVDFLNIPAQTNYLTIIEVYINNQKTKKSIELPTHQDRITGVFFDKKLRVIHSVSKDGFYIITDVQMQNVISAIDIEDEILSLHVSMERQISILGTKNGKVCIFDCSASIPILIRDMYVTGGNALNCIEFDNIINYAFIQGYEGAISIIDLGKQGQEKFSKQTASMKDKQDCRQLCWSNKRREVMVGNADGTITIWNINTGQRICNNGAHSSFITRMKWVENEQTLISCSRELDMRFWRMPLEWMNIGVQQQESEIRRSEIQKQHQQQENENDLDDWHK